MTRQPGSCLRTVRASLWVAALVAVGVGPMAAQTTAAAATVNRAAVAWKSVRTVKGTFEQRVTNSLVGKTALAHGEFEEQRPNKLSVRFTDPPGDAIVADGHYVWLYFPSSSPGQVIRRAASDPGYTPVDFDQFLVSPETRFIMTDAGTASIDGKPTHAVTLVPKPGTSSTFARATVWVNDADALVRQIEVVESGTVTRRIHLLTLSVNVPVDPGAFAFVPPKGTKIINGG